LDVERTYDKFRIIIYELMELFRSVTTTENMWSDFSGSDFLATCLQSHAVLNFIKKISIKILISNDFEIFTYASFNCHSYDITHYGILSVRMSPYYLLCRDRN